MGHIVVFPDLVEAVNDYLRDELADRGWTLTVGTRVPTAGAGTLVRVVRTGGGHDFDPGVPTEKANLTFEAWAATQALSYDLVKIVRALVNVMPGVVTGVRRVDEVGGPGYFPDDFSDQSFRDIDTYPRWRFTVQVTHRGAAEPGS